MKPQYHYIVVECQKFGLAVYAYGVFRGKSLIDKGTFLSEEQAHTTGQRIAHKLNNACKAA